MSVRPSPLERVRRPEHTGENRCVPCTVVNEAIALGVAAVVGAPAWSAAGPSLGVAAAAATFLACSVVVYLRGYLVPGTPALTKRYLPERVLARFDKVPEAVDGDAGQGADDEFDPEAFDPGVDEFDLVDPETVLREADAVEPGEHHDLRLTDDFAAAALAAADRLVDGDRRDVEEARAAALRTLFEPSDEVRVATEDGRPVAYDGRDRLNGWPSEAAMVADLAAHEALADRDGEWGAVVATQKLGILRALRGFRETCPVCRGRVGATDDTVESCCRSWEVVAVRCTDCEAHFLELDPGQFDDQLADEMQGPTDGGFTA
jgi:hypothetical protein